MVDGGLEVFTKNDHNYINKKLTPTHHFIDKDQSYRLSYSSQYFIRMITKKEILFVSTTCLVDSLVAGTDGIPLTSG